MNKPLVWVLLIGVLLVAGCDMNSNERFTNLERRAEIIEGRLDSIERKAESLDQRQGIVENYYTEAKKQKETASAAPSEAMSTTDIQTALKNAGFYTGAVDGKMGPATDKAIKDFQAANSLKADGVVGSKTRQALSKHLGGPATN